MRWGDPVPVTSPGVYLVALTDNLESTEESRPRCPLSLEAVQALLDARAELRMDGNRPGADALAERIASFWLPDEAVLYVGLAGTSLASRVDQYYKTPLGARRPHAGGYFLKLLSVLPDLHVHYAPTSDSSSAEDRMLSMFCSNVSDDTKAVLRDPAHPFPFANLEWPAGTRKSHGLTGTREPRADREVGQPIPRPAVPAGEVENPLAMRDPGVVSNLRTQPVTEVDLQAGRIRIPRGATKRALPRERGKLAVNLRGRDLVVSYNPRFDPAPERSGVLGIGRAVLPEVVEAGEVLSVTIANDGTVVLR